VTHGFRQTDERLIHQGFMVRLVAGTFEGPDGSTFERDIIRHPGAVGIVAVDGEDVLLVRQYRPVIDDDLLEIPAGTMDKPGEDPRHCAIRELAEEAGVTAADLRHLTTYYVAPGISDERFHLFLATGLSHGPTAADGPDADRRRPHHRRQDHHRSHPGS
jgi:8-oxo-dGTP pyrophosphatase MutT (NUDIX family)